MEMCCGHTRNTNYCSYCGKRLRTDIESLLVYLETRAQSVSTGNWEAWADAVRKLQNEYDRILTFEESEKLLIQKALKKTKGNRSKAAKLLDVSERTFYRKLDIYGLREQNDGNMRKL